ncbi:transcriptional regulator [Polynucleobacter sp. SHI8]|uniref:LysR family transcriptional regulator n=1 Tax=unclassified Polynucleobacter TaxID=2640945 RepID=UPI0024938B79|nr:MULTISPECIES: LysR family transcriptional regulator [unclassified Polynucleobacter]BDW10273.1 transcriptional regulator [Polynucleobacter sp. SHI2]BDW12719.1 transcriptional regulator [Polynucleobacter sp. SHI8]
MELRHLRYFVAVAQEEHMTRAAAKLGIQQPPLTQQIQLLEKELGVKLFLRESRRIQLSPAGRVFLTDAQAILASVDQAVLRVQRFELGEEGNLRLGFTSSASMHQMTPDLVRTFRHTYPLIQLDIEEGAAHDLMNALAQEKIDVAFSRSSVKPYLGIASVELLKEDMVVAIPMNHPLSSIPNGVLSLKDLRDENFIFYQQVNGSGIKESLINECAKVGFEPKSAQVVYRIMGALHIVASGLGIAIVPKSMQAIQPDSVVYKTFHPNSVLTVPLSLAYRENSSKLAVKRFLKLAHDFTNDWLLKH